jgi:hypothetical protein
MCCGRRLPDDIGGAGRLLLRLENIMTISMTPIRHIVSARLGVMVASLLLALGMWHGANGSRLGVKRCWLN